MARPLLRWLWAMVVGALLLVAGGARADEDRPASPMTPRDVVDVLEPADALFGAVPPDFQRIEHGWLTLELPTSVADRVPVLLREADAFRSRLSDGFEQRVLDHVLVRIARDPEQMATLAPQGWPPPPYAAGVAYGKLHLAILALQAPQTWEAPDLIELLRHELTHVALSEAVLGHHVPRWFDEGLAIHESGEVPWGRLKTLWDAEIGHRVVPLAELDRGFPVDGYEVNVAYAESADFVRFLLRDSDRARFGSLLERLRGGAPFDRALEDAYGTDLRKLEYEWREDMNHRFSVIPMLTGGGAVWTLAAVLAVLAWVKRRRRAKTKLAEWAREEAEMDAMAARRRESPTKADDEELPPSIPSIPVVEHEGRWYTVH